MDGRRDSTIESELQRRRAQFGNKRSLSEYAVSLPSQPEDITGLHIGDDRFHFFQRGREFQAQHSKHHYTPDELRVLETYESADNLPSHTEVYRQWLQDLPPRGVAETWYLVTVIGVIIGTLAFVMKECCESLQIFSNPFMGEYIARGETYRLWIYYAVMSCTLSSASAFICVYFCPWAAGSGLPEIIGILNGCVVRNMLSFKTLICKILSVLLTVLSSLPVGFEGPMIHIGAMVAAAMARPVECKCTYPRRIVPDSELGVDSLYTTQNATNNAHPRTQSSPQPVKSSKSGCCGLRLCRYRDCKERHNLICMGAAAGVASAFSAPITGLLFAMEEMSSFWSPSLTWQTFVCCILARSVTEIFRSVVASLTKHERNSTFIGRSQFGVFEFSESALFDMKEHLRLNLLIGIPTILIGLIGGLSGAFFIFCHLKLARFRRRLLAKVSRPEWLNAIKVLEPMVVALISSMVVMGTLRFFTCRDVNHTADIGSAHEGKYLKFHAFQCDKPLIIEFQHGKVIQTGQYHEMATLVFGSWEQMIRNLFSRKTADIFTWKSTLILLIFFFFCSSWASLCCLANGLLIPQLVIGALYGRLFGRVMVESFGKMSLDKAEAGEWEWMDPGVFALLGSASFLAGTSRLPITSVVMLVEMTNDINMSLLIMIVVMLAKFVGGLFTHPLYHSMCEFKCIPYLDPQINLRYKSKKVNLELFKAADVMAAPVITVNVQESVRVLANLLLDTNHGGFPVVISEFGFRKTFLGMITRLELIIILTKTISFNAKELGKEDMEKIGISYPEYSSSKLSDTTVVNEILNSYAEDLRYAPVTVNLLPYINTSSYSVPPQFSLERTYTMFRTLGARHIAVTDQHNQVLGIITRKDLMGFRVDEKIMEIMRRGGLRRQETFHSPTYIQGGRRGTGTTNINESQQKAKHTRKVSNQEQMKNSQSPSPTRKHSIQEETQEAVEEKPRNFLQAKRRLSPARGSPPPKA